jgi:phytoene dehydrogenase-like protein
MAKIVIVGGGIAGLSAGIHGQLNGFETEIFEQNASAGGECTGWDRGGYHFDGCLHWLVGSKPGTPVNTLMHTVGALDETVGIVNHEYFYCAEENGETVYMYRNVDRLEKHLLAVSPQDEKLIRETCKAIKALGKLEMPLDKPAELYSTADNLKMLPKIFPYMGLMRKYSSVTIEEFANQFKHPLIQNAFKQGYPTNLSALVLLMIFSSLNQGDSGLPLGGSKKLAERMAQKYASLGGKIHYSTAVDVIKVSGGRAEGVIMKDGSEHLADVVVSSVDGNFTLQHLLKGKFTDETFETLYSDMQAYPTFASVHVSVGVACDLSDEPHWLFFKPTQPVDGGGYVNSWLGLNHYSYDPTFASKGKSVVAASFLGSDYDWWKQKAQDKAVYKAEKQRVAQEVCSAVEERFPQAKGKIEVVDVATPVTYERYCNAWRGAYMSWGPTPKSKIRTVPGKLAGLNGFYMAGQWTMLPGINGGVITGRWAIQRVCRDLKLPFAK